MQNSNIRYIPEVSVVKKLFVRILPNQKKNLPDFTEILNLDIWNRFLNEHFWFVRIFSFQIIKISAEGKSFFWFIEIATDGSLTTLQHDKSGFIYNSCGRREYNSLQRIHRQIPVTSDFD